MADVMIIRVALTEQDYVRANRGLRAKSHPLMPIYYVGIALFELGLVSLLAGSDQPLSPFVWLLALPFPILIAWVFVIVPVQVRRTVRGNDRFLTETTWELGDDGVFLKNRYTESRYDWGSFERLVEDTDYFFLQHTTPKKFYKFIPKRVFATPEQLAQFRDLVNRQMAAHRAASS